MERSKVIEASGASKDAASARITQARSGVLPKVNYSESWARSDNPVFVFSSLLMQRRFTESNFGIASLNRPDFLNNFQSLLTADQSLYDAGKTKRAVRTAKLGEDISREDIRRSQLEVIVQVARFYYDTQLEAEQVKATTQAMRSAQADLERAEARRSSGMATDADVLSIHVHLARRARGPDSPLRRIRGRPRGHERRDWITPGHRSFPHHSARALANRTNRNQRL
jgi:outer membrane protein TolC